MAKAFDPMTTVLSAIANASRVPATRDDVRTLLRGGPGEASHIRALFGDVALSTLLRLAIAEDISDDVLANAYVRARSDFAAASPEMDAFARDIVGAAI